MSGVSHINKNKSTVECGSTDKDGEIKISSKEIKAGMTDTRDGMMDTRDGMTDTRDGMTNTRDVNTGEVRTPSYSETVRKNINNILSSPEGQAIGKPSEQSLTKLIKI